MDKARLYVLPGFTETFCERVTLKGLTLKKAPSAWKLYIPVRGLTVERPVLGERPMPLTLQTVMSGLSKPPLMIALARAGGGEAVAVGEAVEVAVEVTEIVLGEGLARERTFPPMTLLLGTRLVLCHSCSCNCGSGYLLRLPGLEGALRVAVLADVADGNALCVCCAGLQAVGESCCLYQLEISSVVVSGTGDLQGNAVGGVYALVVLRARGLCRAGGG